MSETDREPEVLLDLRDISMIYPGTVALNRVSLDVRAGECHGVIGKNGAGKTTLMRIISGLAAPTEGRLFIRGRELKSLSRKESRRAGIAIVTQEPQIIPDFTVAENLFYPGYIRGPAGLIRWGEIFRRAEEIVGRAGFHLNVRANASDLSISEQQLLLVLKAFFVEEDRVVILDEVTAALTQKDQEFLFRLIGLQTADGKAILFISHRLGEIMRICHRVTVLRDGRKIATCPVPEIDEPELSRLIVGDGYAGEKTGPLPARPGIRPGSPDLLSVEGLTRAGMFRDIRLRLQVGEVLGLAGLRGSGRTELLKAIAGILKPDRGTIRLDGGRIRPDTPSRALKHGIVYLPEDRDAEGLIEMMSVRFNLTLSSLGKLTRGLVIRREEERRTAEDMIRRLEIRAASPDQEAQSLSGGNRQKVVIGRLIAAAPRVFLLDEPTKGIDIGAKATILQIVRQRLPRDAGVVITSPSLEELLQVSDRIMVLHEGKVAGEISREAFDPERIYLAMQGMERRSS